MIEGNYGYLGDLKKQANIISETLNPNNASRATVLLLATAAVETSLGKVTDKTLYAGMGLCQFDKIPFYRVRDKSMKHRKKILKNLHIDIRLVEWEDLRYNPFLSLLFCRLYYLQVSEPIPNLPVEMAHYWKKYYNTYLGKGKIKHFVRSYNKYVTPLILE